MSGLLTFEGIKSTVESHYPTPVASVFRRCRVTKKEDLGGRHKNVIDLFEVFTKFLCIVQLQEARQYFPNLKERLPEKGKTLEFLKRPSLGQWNGLIRILCKLDLSTSETTWISKIAKWYSQGKNEENTHILKCLADITEINFQRKTKTPNAEICNALVNYRNKLIAHGANINEEVLSKRLPILESVLSYLLVSANFLDEMKLFFADRIEVAESKQWLIHAVRLTGSREEPSTYMCSEELEKHEVYVSSESEGGLSVAPIPLTPLFIWRGKECFIYNDAWRTKLEYLSYASGARYYHKDIHESFKDLVTLKLRPGVEEDVHKSLSPEERTSYAETFFKKAMLHRDHHRFEDALDYLELSVEYERRATTFLEMAKIQYELNDSKEIVYRTLQNCLDIDSSNEDAFALMSEWQKMEEYGEIQYGTGQEKDAIQFPTIFHILTPEHLRMYSTWFWIGILVFWYGFSIICDVLTGFLIDIPLVLLVLFGSLTTVITITKGRIIAIRLRLPLSLQLDSMRLDRFNKWFNKQMLVVFSPFEIENGKLNVKKSWLKYKRTYLLLGFVILLLVIGALVHSATHKLNFFLIVKRIIDVSLWTSIQITLAYYITYSTLFVFQYSKLSLKPMLTRIIDVGLRSLVSFLKFNIGMVCLVFISIWITGFLARDTSLYIDFAVLVFTSTVFLIWSLGMPLAIRSVARQAVSKGAQEYTTHLEKAYKAFLNDPTDDERLKTYEKLLSRQKVIRNIPTWPLSWTETVFVVFGSNLILFLVSCWYIIARLGYLPAVMEWIQTVVS